MNAVRTKGASHAAVATHGSRRTGRCDRTRHGPRLGARPGGCSRFDGSSAAQSIGLSARPRHLRRPTGPPCLARCRGRRPSRANGLEGRSRSAGKRVLILPTYEQGTWAEQVVVPARNLVLMSDEADPVQLSMIGINPSTAYLLLSRYVSLMPSDWIGQTAANSAMGQYIIALAKLAGIRTLNV